MVHVENGHRRAEFMQRRQQKNRICAAGDGDTDSSPVSNCCRNLIDHTSILRESNIQGVGPAHVT